MWRSVCSGVCFTVLMMERQPSADNLCLFYGLLPSCSMWAINLSPAISKQCSNQWEIISANRWASLSISPSLYLSCCPICIAFSHPANPPPFPHPFCLIFAVSLFFPPTPSLTPHPPATFTCIPSSSLGSAAPTLKCDSSAAPEPLTKVAFTQGICNIAGLTFLADIMSLTCSYNQRILPLTDVTTQPTYCTLCCCCSWSFVARCTKPRYFSVFLSRMYFNKLKKFPKGLFLNCEWCSPLSSTNTLMLLW